MPQASRVPLDWSACPIAESKYNTVYMVKPSERLGACPGEQFNPP